MQRINTVLFLCILTTGVFFGCVASRRIPEVKLVDYTLCSTPLLKEIQGKKIVLGRAEPGGKSISAVVPAVIEYELRRAGARVFDDVGKADMYLEVTFFAIPSFVELTLRALTAELEVKGIIQVRMIYTQASSALSYSYGDWRWFSEERARLLDDDIQVFRSISLLAITKLLCGNNNLR